jgi:hypothetical protein
MLRALVVIISMLCASAAAAQQTPTPDPVKVAMRPVTSFGYLDADKDARLSRDEAKADWAVHQGFERADANSDGYLDRREFTTLQKS